MPSEDEEVVYRVGREVLSDRHTICLQPLHECLRVVEQTFCAPRDDIRLREALEQPLLALALERDGREVAARLDEREVERSPEARDAVLAKQLPRSVVEDIGGRVLDRRRVRATPRHREVKPRRRGEHAPGRGQPKLSVLDEVQREGDGEVAACGIASDDDVLWRKARVLYEVAIRGEGVEERGGEGVRGRIGCGRGEAVVDGERTFDCLRVGKKALGKIGGDVGRIGSADLDRHARWV